MHCAPYRFLMPIGVASASTSMKADPEEIPVESDSTAESSNHPTSETGPAAENEPLPPVVGELCDRENPCQDELNAQRFYDYVNQRWIEGDRDFKKEIRDYMKKQFP